MVSWADVASKGLDFLKNPSGFGLAIVAMLLLFLLAVAPSGLLGWYMATVQDKNTDRIVHALEEVQDTLKQSKLAFKKN